MLYLWFFPAQHLPDILFPKRELKVLLWSNKLTDGKERKAWASFWSTSARVDEHLHEIIFFFAPMCLVAVRKGWLALLGAWSKFVALHHFIWRKWHPQLVKSELKKSIGLEAATPTSVMYTNEMALKRLARNINQVANVENKPCL